MNGNTERKWEEIQPEAGSYVHESNQFMVDWKEKFWGRNYEALREVKGRYDPRNALYVAQGVGSDDWIVDEGRLCKL
jgi:FAD/FMN-containing dehydrogenase